MIITFQRESEQSPIINSHASDLSISNDFVVKEMDGTMELNHEGWLGHDPSILCMFLIFIHFFQNI